MTNEWEKVELFGPNRDGEIVRFGVNDSTNVSKGQLMQLVDPRTVSSVVAYGAAVAGVAASEKVAGDGDTSIGCQTQGIFEVQCSSATDVGKDIGMAGVNNRVDVMTVVSGMIIGRALEDAGTDEVINVRLDL
ncbi:hypothetical protein LCGC14_2580590 [marine sediment metagenome]|uniref:Uncharacterized protein n=1 Tax=marine sediment metagenome TaxID=412755 RepID=A0A0F9AEY3_9ZZZZ